MPWNESHAKAQRFPGLAAREGSWSDRSPTGCSAISKRLSSPHEDFSSLRRDEKRERIRHRARSTTFQLGATGGTRPVGSGSAAKTQWRSNSCMSSWKRC